MSKKHSKALGQKEILAQTVIVGMVEPILPHMLEAQKTSKLNVNDPPVHGNKKELENLSQNQRHCDCSRIAKQRRFHRKNRDKK